MNSTPSLLQFSTVRSVVIKVINFLSSLENRDVEENRAPTIQGEIVSDLICHRDMHNPVGPAGIHPLSRYWRIWQKCSLRHLPSPTGYPRRYQVTKGQQMPTYKKGWKENLGTYRPVSLALVPGHGSAHRRYHPTWAGLPGHQAQHGFMEGRSCWTNLLSLYEKFTHSVKEGETEYVVCLDSSKAFDPVSHCILLEKLAAFGLDRRPLW